MPESKKIPKQITTKVAPTIPNNIFFFIQSPPVYQPFFGIAFLTFFAAFADEISLVVATILVEINKTITILRQQSPIFQ